MVRRAHRGFTLIEILVVLGIILLLLGMTILGYQHIEKVTAERATRASLESLHAILNQFESSATLGPIEGPFGSAAAAAGSGTPGCIYSYGGTPNSPGNPPAIAATTYNGVPLPSGQRWPTVNNVATTSVVADVNFGSQPDHGYIGSRYSPNGSEGPNPVYLTGLITYHMSRIPSVKTALQQFPSTQLLTNSDNSIPNVAYGPLSITDPITHAAVPLIIVLDGWKNPIIYVPSGGMHGVFLGGVMSVSTVQSNLIGTRMKVTSIDNRPFWASAGQDGNFSTGDDNIYSSPVRYTPE